MPSSQKKKKKRCEDASTAAAAAATSAAAAAGGGAAAPAATSKSQRRATRKKAQQRELEQSNAGKVKLRSASDTISRILHDPSLPTAYFTFGYLDRHIGIVEKPLAAANWSDSLDTLDLRTTFAVPQHRVQWLKCNGEVVWRKKDRLDRFWGGNGNHGLKGKACSKGAGSRANSGHGGIHDVIAQQRERGLIRSDGSVDYQLLRNESGEESEKRKKGKDHSRAKPKSQRKMDERAERALAHDMPTHFFCVKVSGAAVQRAVFRAQKALCVADQRLEEGCAVLRSLHITIALVRATTSEQVGLAASVLHNASKQLRDVLNLLAEATLKFVGTDDFRGKVAYARLDEQSQHAIGALHEALCRDLREMGVHITGQHREFNPHVTLCKITRPLAIRKVSTLPAAGRRAAAKAFYGMGDADEGAEPSPDNASRKRDAKLVESAAGCGARLFLCPMQKPLGDTGFYPIIAETSIAGNGTEEENNPEVLGQVHDADGACSLTDQSGNDHGNGGGADGVNAGGLVSDVSIPLEQPVTVLYVGVFLSARSASETRSMWPPVHSRLPDAPHVTLAYQPTPSTFQKHQLPQLGQVVTLQASAPAANRRAQIVLCEMVSTEVPERAQSTSKQDPQLVDPQQPLHLTLSHSERSTPRDGMILAEERRASAAARGATQSFSEELFIEGVLGAIVAPVVEGVAQSSAADVVFDPSFFHSGQHKIVACNSSPGVHSTVPTIAANGELDRPLKRLATHCRHVFVFDFDHTLFNTPDPEHFEQVHGHAWRSHAATGHASWSCDPVSLSAPLRRVGLSPGPGLAFCYDCAALGDSVTLILLTGRPRALEPLVAEVLREFGLEQLFQRRLFVHGLARGGKTSHFKRRAVRALLDEFQTPRSLSSGSESEPAEGLLQFHVVDDLNENISAMMSEMRAHFGHARTELRATLVGCSSSGGGGSASLDSATESTRLKGWVQLCRPSLSPKVLTKTVVLPHAKSAIERARHLFGKVFSDRFENSARTLMRVIGREWLKLLRSAGTIDSDADNEMLIAALVLPFGSFQLKRRSDVDVCLLGAPPISSKEGLQALRFALQKRGFLVYWSGDGGRLSLLRAKWPGGRLLACKDSLNDQAQLEGLLSVEFDILCATVDSHHFAKVIRDWPTVGRWTIGSLKRLLERSTSEASKNAIVGPLFASRCGGGRSVNVKEQEQRIGLLGEIVDAVVLLLAAAGLRGNAFQLPRTFHLVTLLSQWLETVNMEVSGASGSLATLVAALQFIVELPLKHWCSVCGLTPHCYVENVRAFLSEVHTLLGACASEADMENAFLGMCMAGAQQTSTELAIEAAAARAGAPLHTHSQSQNQLCGFVAVEVIVLPTTAKSWLEQQQQLFHDTCVLTWLFPGFVRAIGDCTAVVPGLGRSRQSSASDIQPANGPEGLQVGGSDLRGVYAFRMARAAGLRGRIRAAFEEHVVTKSNMNTKPPFSLTFTPRPHES